MKRAAATKTAKPAWYHLTRKYGQSSRGKSLWQMTDTLVPYLALGGDDLYIATTVPLLGSLPFAALAGSILVRVFILFHDCCHGSFFLFVGQIPFWATLRVF